MVPRFIVGLSRRRVFLILATAPPRRGPVKPKPPMSVRRGFGFWVLARRLGPYPLHHQSGRASFAGLAWRLATCVAYYRKLCVPSMAERWQRHIVGAESVRPWFESDLKSRQHTDLAERQGGECRQQRNVAPRLESTEVIGPSGPAGGVHWSVSAQGFWHMEARDEGEQLPGHQLPSKWTHGASS